MFMRGVKLHIHLELDNVSKPYDKPKLIMQVGKGKLLWLEQWTVDDSPVPPAGHLPACQDVLGRTQSWDQEARVRHLNKHASACTPCPLC